MKALRTIAKKNGDESEANRLTEQIKALKQRMNDSSGDASSNEEPDDPPSDPLTKEEAYQQIRSLEALRKAAKQSGDEAEVDRLTNEIKRIKQRMNTLN